MKEDGVFRTSFFGGFNKKDVFEYFEKVKNEGSSDSQFLYQKNADLLEQVEKKDMEIEELEKKVAFFSSRLRELKGVQDEVDKINEMNTAQNARISELEELLASSQNKIEVDSTYKARCDSLSHKVVRVQSELMAVKGQLQKEKSKNEALAIIIRSMPDLDLDAIEQSASVLKDLSATLEKVDSVQRHIDSAKKKLN